ncbi:hypothetical protein BC332_07204 [Capsicum chinense]|nr:hypothetical protein BC332_07204 [Capsicum chinense]
MGETTLIRSDMVFEAMEKVWLIRERLKASQSHQKFYADIRRRDLEFEVDDLVYLKVLPMKGVKRFGHGILHFHERDLAGCFILFSNNPQEGINRSAKGIVATSTAFKYKKFNPYDNGLKLYKENHSLTYASDESLISIANGASDLFQFIDNVLSNNRVEESTRVPITQDATASAYKIMSYLLLNKKMAKRTNLISHPDRKIQDVYLYLL